MKLHFDPNQPFQLDASAAIIDLVLESSQDQKLQAFQITWAEKTALSRAFDAYQPVQTFVVTPENAYRFCW
jgi:hypothetical protein